MASKLIVAFVVVSPDRRVLDRAVHPFNLAVGPGMIWFGQPMFDVIGVADQVKSHLAGECPELCVSGAAHAGFRYVHALKRSSNMIAN